MKKVKIVHNPGAGDGAPNRKELVSMVDSAGYKSSYTSTKEEGWEKLKLRNEDLIVIAGGDGTVRNVAAHLLEKKLIDRIPPIGLLPLGTANNIARALGIPESHDEAIKTWKNKNIRAYDVGKIHGLGDPTFFLEGFGYGIFPLLIRKMKKTKKINEPVKLKIARSLELLLEIILTIKPRLCQLKIDGMECAGKFLLAEVMNTPSIGSNLAIAPTADPGDGQLEVVLITEEQREEFAAYIRNKIEGRENPPLLTTIKTRKLEISWEESILHVDDVYLELDKPVSISVELMENCLEFLTEESS